MDSNNSIAWVVGGLVAAAGIGGGIWLYTSSKADAEAEARKALEAQLAAAREEAVRAREAAQRQPVYQPAAPSASPRSGGSGGFLGDAVRVAQQVGSVANSLKSTIGTIGSLFG
jgi:hypothetical protein